ncbi:MAG: TetR family transcriptional regulator [Rhodobiaceae bacterium]|nr:MAG: TetR family transcriptional regulator [Rhodobiaceae bacterium]
MDLKIVASEDKPPKTSTLKRNNERPRQILNAAIELFCELGFEAARLEDIADRAGVSKATIYLYFESKEDLFFALIRENVVPMVDETISQMESFEGPASDFLRFKAHTLGHTLAYTNQGAILKLVVAESRRFPEIADYFRTEVPERGIENLAKLIQRGIDDGEFRPCDAKTAAALFMFPLLMNGIWMNSLGPDTVIDPGLLIEMHCENFIRGLTL